MSQVVKLAASSYDTSFVQADRIILFFGQIRHWALTLIYFFYCWLLPKKKFESFLSEKLVPQNCWENGIRSFLPETFSFSSSFLFKFFLTLYCSNTSQKLEFLGTFFVKKVFPQLESWWQMFKFETLFQRISALLSGKFECGYYSEAHFCRSPVSIE